VSRSTCGPWASSSLPIVSAMKLSTTPESSKSALGCGSSSAGSSGSGCLWLGRLRLWLRRKDDLFLVGEAIVVVFTSAAAVDRDLFLNLPNTELPRLGPGRLPPLLVSDFCCFSSWTGGSATSAFSSTSSCGSISLFVWGSIVVVVVVDEGLADSFLPLPLVRELNLPVSLEGLSLNPLRGAFVVDVASTAIVLSVVTGVFSFCGMAEDCVVGADVDFLREFLKRAFNLPRPKRPLLGCLDFVVVGANVVVVVVASVDTSGIVTFAVSSISGSSKMTTSSGLGCCFFCFWRRFKRPNNLPLVLFAAVVAAAGLSVVFAPPVARLLKLGLGLLILLGRLPFVVGEVVVVTSSVVETVDMVEMLVVVSGSGFGCVEGTVCLREDGLKRLARSEERDARFDPLRRAGLVGGVAAEVCGAGVASEMDTLSASVVGVFSSKLLAGRLLGRDANRLVCPRWKFLVFPLDLVRVARTVVENGSGARVVVVVGAVVVVVVDGVVDGVVVVVGVVDDVVVGTGVVNGVVNAIFVSGNSVLK